MGVFDTHGGYFAPAGYTKVNTGGSHDENPNGGVQLGVDEQGIPNMLEEGEPVYNDYVFSDNIYADGGILEKHNLPKKFAGKLYSDIVEEYIDSERPNDAIANNGTNKMLVRLMEAQEEQKQMEEQAELEKELASLSPEEQAELAQMLQQQEMAAQEGQEMPVDMGVPQQEVMPEEIAPEQVAPEMIEHPQQFKYGGPINRFDMGNPIQIADETPFAVRDNTATPFMVDSGLRATPPTVEQIAAHRAREQAVVDKINHFFNGPDDVNALMVNIPINATGKALDYYKDAVNVEKKLKEAKQALRAARKSKTDTQVLEKSVSDLKQALKLNLSEGKRELGSRPKYAKQSQSAAEAGQVAEQVAKKARKPLSKGAKWAIGVGSATGVGAAGTAAVNAYIKNHHLDVPASQTGLWDIPEDGEDWEFVEDDGMFAKGGRINRFDNGGWEDFYNTLRNYNVSTGNGGVRGTYAIDKNFDYSGYNSILDYEKSKDYVDFTNYVLANPTNENVQQYLKLLDEYTAKNNGVDKLFDANGSLVSNWQELYNNRRNDQTGGIYHLNFTGYNQPVNNPAAAAAAGNTPSVAYNSQVIWPGVRQAPYALQLPQYNLPNTPERKQFERNSFLFNLQKGKVNIPQASSSMEIVGDPSLFGGILISPAIKTGDGAQRPTITSGKAGKLNNAGLSGEMPVSQRGNYSFFEPDEETDNIVYTPLSTSSRYLAAIPTLAQLAHNLSQPEERIEVPNINPVLPEGRMNLVPLEYRSVDPNLYTTQLLHQNMAAQRGAMESGNPVSAPASVAAINNNATTAYGNAQAQAYDNALNRKNTVISGNNASEAQRAQFDASIRQARAGILNRANELRAQYRMLAKRLEMTNDMQEAQAISSQLNAISETLANLGRENFVMNQVNSNRALGYGSGLAGLAYYKYLMDTMRDRDTRFGMDLGI